MSLEMDTNNYYSIIQGGVNLNSEETVEVEIDYELLVAVTLAATEQGLTTEQYIRYIVEKYVEGLG